MNKVLILGGTEDGLALHRQLEAEDGIEPMLSLAGRTATPKGLPRNVRIGGFGGMAGLSVFLETNDIVCIVDATHPFAGQISAHAAAAARQTSTPCIALVRPPWQAGPGDKWTAVGSETEAAAALPAGGPTGGPGGGRVFLALGAQKLKPFAHRGDTEFVIRVIDPPEVPLLPFPHTVIIGRGPFRVASETKLFAEHGISHLVARNSGGKGAAAKLAAARDLGLAVIMINRPEVPEGPAIASVDEARNWVMDQLG